MGFIPKPLNLLFGGLGALLGHKRRQPIMPRPVTRETDLTQVEAADELRRRRGAAADMITGVRGAEAMPSRAGSLVLGA